MISKVVVRSATVALAVGALVCCAASACTINIGNPSSSNSPRVSKQHLQEDISKRLSSAGNTPQSVSCPQDLAGEVGQSTRCEVTMSASSGLEPIVTVTGVEGTKVHYDITPAVSKTQLETAVSQMIARSSKAPVSSVSCLSGLDGKVGAVAYCNVTAQAATIQRTVEVTGVSGLAMNYHLVPILPTAVAEGSLAYQLKQTGQHPDSVTCAGNLEGKLGNTVECTTVTAGHTRTYILTVTTVDGDNITYKYALKP